jgi:hypothetical protein
MNDIDHPETLGGPHFDPAIIGPNGRLQRFHKGPKTKKPTSSQLLLERKQAQLIDAQLAEMERQRLQPTPEAPKALPALAPPTSTNSADTAQAEADARRKSLRRMAPGRSTIFAGETSAAVGGRKTILG